MDIKIPLVRFFSKGDEHRFFDALDDIAAIKGYAGSGRELVLKIDRRILDAVMLRELIALLCRYGVDLSPLSVLATSKRFKWIQEPHYYWHRQMFEEQ